MHGTPEIDARTSWLARARQADTVTCAGLATALLGVYLVILAMLIGLYEHQEAVERGSGGLDNDIVLMCAFITISGLLLFVPARAFLVRAPGRLAWHASFWPSVVVAGFSWIVCLASANNLSLGALGATAGAILLAHPGVRDAAAGRTPERELRPATRAFWAAAAIVGLLWVAGLGAATTGRVVLGALVALAAGAAIALRLRAAARAGARPGLPAAALGAALGALAAVFIYALVRELASTRRVISLDHSAFQSEYLLLGLVAVAVVGASAAAIARWTKANPSLASPSWRGGAIAACTALGLLGSLLLASSGIIHAEAQTQLRNVPSLGATMVTALLVALALLRRRGP